MNPLYSDLVVASEVSRCMLCHDAPCTKSCKKERDPARGLRALRFQNPASAGYHINRKTCSDCDAPCETACLHFERVIPIKEIGETLSPQTLTGKDLSIEFCGVKCENPFFLSSSVVASGYDMCAKALNMGWAGIVYKTIAFYMPQEVSPRFDATQDANRSFEGFKNLEQISDKTPEHDFEVLRRLKEDFPTKIIVASIMGQSDQEWTSLARMSQEAGCDIIECNFSCPHMSQVGLGSDVGQSPDLVAQYTRATRKGSTLPILAKMTPNISHMEIPAMAAMEAGADGLAAINTIKSISGINHITLASSPDVNGKSSVSGYSGRCIKPIALRFVHDMAKCPSLAKAPISGMGGIETYLDALDFLSLGCGNLQITTSVMEYGYRIIDDLLEGLSQHMQDNNIEKLADLVGTALDQVISADDLDRKTIVYPKLDGKKCVKCKRCYLSCYDGGHQALFVGEDGSIRMDGKKCVGCHLCRLVCPTAAIGTSVRIEKG